MVLNYVYIYFQQTQKKGFLKKGQYSQFSCLCNRKKKLRCARTEKKLNFLENRRLIKCKNFQKYLQKPFESIKRCDLYSYKRNCLKIIFNENEYFVLIVLYISFLIASLTIIFQMQIFIAQQKILNQLLCVLSIQRCLGEIFLFIFIQILTNKNIYQNRNNKHLNNNQKTIFIHVTKQFKNTYVDLFVYIIFKQQLTQNFQVGIKIHQTEQYNKKFPPMKKLLVYSFTNLTKSQLSLLTTYYQINFPQTKKFFEYFTKQLNLPIHNTKRLLYLIEKYPFIYLYIYYSTQNIQTKTVYYFN
eukprot:TRINITY_DN1730_c0_g2_i13.p1 TRINITY_DN1730_c0_g2~~TRINITY_DN1730_c0_g2_i13.p1  ORF type:complete len:300 (-),score=-25.41 TRINITY_DN1730_c0_g2_i13:590-1489(-)